MPFKEFKTQSVDELKKLLAEKKDRLRIIRFKVAQRQLKKIHEIKNTKKEIARLLTLINVNHDSSGRQAPGK